MQKKYPRSLITLRLNHWYPMDNFNNVLATFLGLKSVSCFAIYAGSESSRMSSNISFICVPKINGSLMDLERREGEYLRHYFLGGGANYPFKSKVYFFLHSVLSCTAFNVYRTVDESEWTSLTHIQYHIIDSFSPQTPLIMYITSNGQYADAK